MGKSCNLNTTTQCIPDSKNYYESLLKVDAEFIETIQYHYKVIEDQLRWLNLISAPSFIYFYIFPFAFYLAPGVGIASLWAAIIADFFSFPLKQLINTHRPYWWVRISPSAQNISLLQYDVTCQVLSGMPSNRIMVTTACWLTILNTVYRNLKSCERKGYTFLLTLILILIGIARAFYATNFIHQIVLSYIIGWYIANKVSKFPLYNASPIVYFRMAVIILGIGQVYIQILSHLGFSQKWSYCKAEMACMDKDRIPKNFKFVYESYMRQAALMGGVGFSLLLYSTFTSKRVYLKFNLLKKVFSYSVVQAIMYIVRCLVLPDLACLKCGYTPYMYYRNISIVYFAFPIIVIIMVPRLTHLYQN